MLPFGLGETTATTPAKAGPIPLVSYVPFDRPKDVIIIEEPPPKLMFNTRLKDPIERENIEKDYKEQNQVLAEQYPGKDTNIKLEQKSIVVSRDKTGKEITEQIYDFDVKEIAKPAPVVKDEKGAAVVGEAGKAVVEEAGEVVEA